MHTATQLFNWLSASGTITSNPSTYMALQHSASGLCVWGQTSSTDICEPLVAGAPLVLTTCPSTTAATRVCGWWGYGLQAVGSLLAANNSLYVTATNASFPTLAALSGASASNPSYNQRFLTSCQTTGPCASDTYSNAATGRCDACPANTGTGPVTGATSSAACTAPYVAWGCSAARWNPPGGLAAAGTEWSYHPWGRPDNNNAGYAPWVCNAPNASDFAGAGMCCSTSFTGNSYTGISSQYCGNRQPTQAFPLVAMNSPSLGGFGGAPLCLGSRAGGIAAGTQLTLGPCGTATAPTPNATQLWNWRTAASQWCARADKR